MKKIKKALIFVLLCALTACLFTACAAAPAPSTSNGTLYSVTNGAI